MKLLFASTDLLQQKCKKVYDDLHKQFKDKPISPRYFRIQLGISKEVLNHWKNSQPEYFHLIKTWEDILLGELEQFMLKSSYTKSQNHKFNPVSCMLILKAYDREQYAIELFQPQESNVEPITITMESSNAKKGEQGND